MRRAAFVFASLLATIGAASATAPPSPCRTMVFEDSAFTVCFYDARKDELRLAWTDGNGTALRGFGRLADVLGPDAKRVRFAMNAGMFGEDGTPVGLFVERGRQRRGLNTANGLGNFYLKPNGVFWTAPDGTAHVQTSDAFARSNPKPAFATQSGPMLVIGGALHPAIASDGMSRNVRNGVGVPSPHAALFVGSDDPVSFGRLARFFRDVLHCRDALYFDGAISSSWIAARHRVDDANPLGPMVVVLSKQ